MILFCCLSCSLENLPTDVLRCPRCEGEFFVPDPKTTLEPEPRFSDETTKPTTEVNERTLPEIQNTFGHTYSLNAQDNDKFNPSRYNFLPQPVFASTAERKHQINFSDLPPSTECKILSCEEMMIEKQKLAESSRIQIGKRKMGFAGSSHFEPHTSMLQSYSESVIAKSNLKSTGGNESNSSPDLIKMGNSSSRNFPSDEVESVNELAQLEAHTSNPQTRNEGPENACAMLPKDSSASTSKQLLGCGKCSRRFRSEKALNVHVQNNCDPKPYKCNKCPQKFSKECLLILHQVVHTDERRFKCDHCNYAYKRKGSLKRHIEAYHRK